MPSWSMKIYAEETQNKIIVPICNILPPKIQSVMRMKAIEYSAIWTSELKER